MSKTNKNWYPYEETGFYYRLVNDVLLFSVMNDNGSRDTEEGEVDFYALSFEEQEFEKDGEKMSLVEYLRAVEKELQSKE